MFAKDAYGVLNHLGIEKVHVLGISLGGFIAQKFALDYPERVLSLINASSTFGGPNAIVATNETIAKMFAIKTETITADQAYGMRMSVMASKDWLEKNKKLVDQIRNWREQNPQPITAQLNQAHASTVFNVEDRVSSIKVPTLIIHGDADLIVPPKNAQMINEKILNSELVMIQGGPHWSFIQYFEQFNKAIIDFLDKQSK